MSDGRVARRWWPDVLLALLLMAAVLAYLVPLPLNLQSPDEARHLDHAHRVLTGEVLYRDIFDITTPGWVYLMTAMFALFGTTLSTARATVAVIHGGIAMALFASCRRLGVRRALAWVCGFAGVVVCQCIAPGASYHWLATLLCTVILLLCLLATRAVRWAFAIGIALGLLIAVHQQRGAAFSLGIGAFFVAQWFVDRLHRTAAPFGLLLRQLLAIAGGIAVVIVPMLAVITAMAGIGPVWECLVTATLVNYRGAMHTSWGYAWGGYSAIIVVARYAPFALIPTAALTALLCWTRHDLEAARQHVWLTVAGLASLLSIAYFPDIIHYGVVEPIFLVMVADLTEHGLRLLPRRIDRGLGAIVGTAILVAVGNYAYRNVVTMRQAYSIPYETPFGRVDLSSKFGKLDIGMGQVEFYDALRRIVDSSRDRLLYVHPRAIYTNLVAGARNPTRYDLVFPPLYTTPAQMQEVVEELAKSKVQYILWSGRAPHSDAVARFIREHYEPFPGPLPADLAIWELRAPANGGRCAPAHGGPRRISCCRSTARRRLGCVSLA